MPETINQETPETNKLKRACLVVEGLGIPVSEGKTLQKETPRYAIVRGNGQEVVAADDTYIWREDRIQLEYYFTYKNGTEEEALEDALLSAGFMYSKSEDVFIDEEGIFVIYYDF